MIHIWVRATVPWEDAEAARSEVRPLLRERLDLWNAIFNVSYQRFRQRVRELAELNHSRVDGSRVSEWDEIPDGGLVMPVDDDDWFAPGAARMLESEIDPEARAYLWDGRWVEVPISAGHRLYLLRRRLLPWTPPKWICTTNNYAMVKGEGVEALLGNHMSASEWFEPRAGLGLSAGVKRIGRELSIANRTLASLTSLRVHHPRHSFTRPELIRKFRRYKRLYVRPLPAELGWARPYVAKMSELMDELEIKAGV